LLIENDLSINNQQSSNQQSAISVLTVPVDERLQCAAEFRREIVFVDGMQERDGGLIGLQLRDTAGAGGQMTLELGVDAGGKMMLDEISEEPDDIVAAAFLRHGRLSSSGSGFESSKYPNSKPENLKLKPRSRGTRDQLKSRSRSRS
jgi:hypothetical protein